MYCRNCGEQINEGAKFCRRCGTAVASSGASGGSSNVRRIILETPKEQTETVDPLAAVGTPDYAKPAAEQRQMAAKREKQVPEKREKQVPAKAGSSNNSSFYLFDLCKSMVQKHSIPQFIYLILNVLIIGTVVALFTGLIYWQALLIGLALYIVSLMIALSPIGEWMLRKQTGCRRLDNSQECADIDRIFQEVYAQARAAAPSISDKVEVFYSDEMSPNAFATGRRTVCVTKGMLQMPEDQIKATLGHEFGHLAHKDTDLLLFVTVGNMIVTALMFIVKIFLMICGFLISFAGIVAGGRGAGGKLFNVISIAGVGALMWLWSKIGTLLCMKTSRGNEFEADAFSFHLGYGNDLCALLDTICGSAPKGLFATLASSHPDKADRIGHLQQLGATYRMHP